MKGDAGFAEVFKDFPIYANMLMKDLEVFTDDESVQLYEKLKALRKSYYYYKKMYDSDIERNEKRTAKLLLVIHDGYLVGRLARVKIEKEKVWDD